MCRASRILPCSVPSNGVTTVLPDVHMRWRQAQCLEGLQNRSPDPLLLTIRPDADILVVKLVPCGSWFALELEVRNAARVVGWGVIGLNELTPKSLREQNLLAALREAGQRHRVL